MARYTVTLVDDDPVDAHLLSATWQKVAPGITVTAFDGLTSFVAGVEGGHELDGIVLVDARLSEFTGFEIMSWLQKNRPAHGLRVLYSTSRHAADVKRAYECGAQLYVPKPNDLAGMRRMVETLHTLASATCILPHQAAS